MDVLAILTAVIGLIALVFAYGLAAWAGKSDEGTDGMKELSGFIREGVKAFLRREHLAMIPVIIILTILFGLIIDWITAIYYIGGAVFAMLAGLFGIRAAAVGSLNAACAAMNVQMNRSLKIAVRSGSVIGLSAAGLGLIGIGIGITLVRFGVQSMQPVTGFGLGVATVALFGTVAGSIFSKGAVAGSGFISKSKAKLPEEEDPRNPASMAGYSGSYAENTGAGLGLFGVFAAAVIAAVIAGSSTGSINPVFGYTFDMPADAGILFPLLVPAFGIIGSIAGIFLIGGYIKSEPMIAINSGKYLSVVLTVILSLILSWIFFANFNCAISLFVGMAAGAVNGKISHTYTTGSSRRLKKMQERSQAGYMIIGEYGIGMLSAFWPIIVLAAGILASNAFAGYYGITLAAVGMLSQIGMKGTMEAYTAVAGNAAEISRMARLPEEAQEIADKLSLAGRNTAASYKGFSTGTASMTTTALLMVYIIITKLNTVNLTQPMMVTVLIVGALIPVVFSAMTMDSASKAAVKVIQEAKRQFDADGGIMKGASKPDYGKCADESTKAALAGIVAPGLLALLIPLAAGIFLGPAALGSLLIGILFSGSLMSVILVNSNKVGNPELTGGDLFKESGVFCINVLMIFSFMVAVVFAPIIVSIDGLL